MASTIADLFRFYFNIPGLGFVQVYPQNDELEFSVSEHSDFRFYEITIKTSLRMEDRAVAGISDFSKLYNMEIEGKTCEKIQVQVDVYDDCPGVEQWVTSWHTGYIRLSSGNWDRDSCKVEIKVSPQSPLQCITERWERDKNLFDYGGGIVETTPFIGVIEETSCECNWASGAGLPDLGNPQVLYCSTCLTDPDTWSVTKHGLCVGQTAPNGITGGKIRTYWAREFSDSVGVPPGVGWTAVAGGWARPVATTEVQYWDFGTEEGVDAIREEFAPTLCQNGSFLRIWSIVGVDDNGNVGFPNGKELNGILEDLFAECGLTLVSNFLNINPDGSNPSNDIYDTYAPVDAFGLVTYALSDIALTDETEAATVQLATVKKLLVLLKVLFNLDVDINSNGEAVIEHPSYWTNSVQEDLTVPAKFHLIDGKHQYTYDGSQRPKRENFRVAAETDGNGGEFDGYPIRYENICVDDNPDAPEAGFTTDLALTNIAAVIGDEDFFRSKLLLIVSTSAGIINQAVSPLSGDTLLNGNLSFPYLHSRYWTYGRPFRTGYINETLTTMQSITRTKKQTPIDVPASFNEFRAIDFQQLIRTQMGGGKIESATWTAPKNILKLNLKFT